MLIEVLTIKALQSRYNDITTCIWNHLSAARPHWNVQEGQLSVF